MLGIGVFDEPTVFSGRSGLGSLGRLSVCLLVNWPFEMSVVLPLGVFN